AERERWKNQFKSPTGKYVIDFINMEELRMGVAYYELTINDYNFGTRFVPHSVWSADSRFFAVCRYVDNWRLIVPDPHTELVIIDMENQVMRTFQAEDASGFLIPVMINNNTVWCEQTHFSLEGKTEKPITIDFSNFQNWVAFATLPSDYSPNQDNS
ncbi:MAG TPA: hypothetical protein VHO69_18385, partial [Phototrophicaceae bacterium]|nr:hypothetical protein [Phototrophicaceae bacterium]